MQDALVSASILVAAIVVSGQLKTWAQSAIAPGLARTLAVDFFTAAEFCASIFEMGVLMEQLGPLAGFACLFLLITIQLGRWQNATMPFPQVHVVDAIDGKQTLADAVVRIAVLMLAGSVTFRLMCLVWGLELAEGHVGKAASSFDCSVPFSHVATHVSAAAEFIGSFVMGLAPRLYFESPLPKKLPGICSAVVLVGLMMLCGLPAASISGGIYNPLMATMMFGGCEGHSLGQHLAIYWLAAIAGAIVANAVYPKVHAVVMGQAESKAKSS